MDARQPLLDGADDGPAPALAGAAAAPPAGAGAGAAAEGGGSVAVLLDDRWSCGSPACHPSAPPATPGSPLRRRPSVAEGLGSRAEQLVGDDYKERHRRNVRTVFNFLRWRQHRSSSRYLRHMLGGGVRLLDTDSGVTGAFDLPSKVLGLAGPLMYVFAISLAVAVFETLAEAGMVPRPWAGFNIANNAPFQLSSFALSLLLVFRTNASYARFLDARKAWGSVANRSRDLARQGLAYLPPGQAELRAMLCRWVVAFSHSLVCSLREGEDEGAGLSGVLPPGELAALLSADHRPNYCLQVLSSVVAHAQQQLQQAQGEQQPFLGMLLRMDTNLTALEDAMGTCERLLRTPIPLAYTRHTSRFLVIWITLLPLTLWESCGWAMLPLSVVISFLLLGIEEIGVSIEEPFSILPLCHICGTISRNVEELHAATAGLQGGACVPAGTSPPDRLVAAALQDASGPQE